MLDWTINNDFIFGVNHEKLHSLKNVKRINLFDLDYTVIKTASGRKFPKDKNDWTFIYDKVPQVLDNKEYLNGIISNQSGLTKKEKIDNWIFKLNNICKKSNIAFVFASIGHNKYRKPLCHSWYHIKSELFDNIKSKNLIQVIKNKVYYIGDACGRKDDFSDTDIKFAENCKLKFKTPELFFKPENYKNSDKLSVITYPNLKYYDKDFLKNLLNKINKKISKHDKILIMFMGFPASGKSFLRKFLINNLDNFYYFNNDDIKQQKINNNKNTNNYNKLVLEPLKYDRIINDNTNLNGKERITTLKKYKNYYKIGISFDLNDKLLEHLNYLRMYEFNEKAIPKVVYNKLKKDNRESDIKFDSGFDYFIKIKKLFPDYKKKTSLKYYF